MLLKRLGSHMTYSSNGRTYIYRSRQNMMGQHYFGCGCCYCRRFQYYASAIDLHDRDESIRNPFGISPLSAQDNTLEYPNRHGEAHSKNFSTGHRPIRIPCRASGEIYVKVDLRSDVHCCHSGNYCHQNALKNDHLMPSYQKTK